MQILAVSCIDRVRLNVFLQCGVLIIAIIERRALRPDAVERKEVNTTCPSPEKDDVLHVMRSGGKYISKIK